MVEREGAAAGRGGKGNTAEGGRQADGRQTLGKFPPPTHAHIEGVCVCVEVENAESG